MDSSSRGSFVTATAPLIVWFGQRCLSSYSHCMRKSLTAHCRQMTFGSITSSAPRQFQPPIQSSIHILPTQYCTRYENDGNENDGPTLHNPKHTLAWARTWHKFEILMMFTRHGCKAFVLNIQIEQCQEREGRPAGGKNASSSINFLKSTSGEELSNVCSQLWRMRAWAGPRTRSAARFNTLTEHKDLCVNQNGTVPVQFHFPTKPVCTHILVSPPVTC